jgi:hypothetical protein
VKEIVEEMLADNIIEESYSSYVNPLTLVQRDGKRVRICLDAREANKFMSLDRAKVHPIHMLLRDFMEPITSRPWIQAALFINTTGEKNLKVMDSFQFQNKVYHIHASHIVSEILSLHLLGHFNRYWGLKPAYTRHSLYW